MSFDRLARCYAGMEWILAGEKLQRCRTHHLARVHAPARVLLAGEGHGRFLPRLLAMHPDAEVVCVDSSPRMLEVARSRWEAREGGGRGRVPEFVQADLREWGGPSERFDLVVCHFFLDCFPEPQLRQVIANLRRVSRPGAHWLIADFTTPDSGWRRWRARLILWSMYRFFRLATRLPARSLTPPENLLMAAGLELLHRQDWEWGLLHSDFWRLRPHVGP